MKRVLTIFAITAMTCTIAKARAAVEAQSAPTGKQLPNSCRHVIANEAGQKLHQGDLRITRSLEGDYIINYVDNYFAVGLSGSSGCYQAIVESNLPTDSTCQIKAVFPIPCG